MEVNERASDKPCGVRALIKGYSRICDVITYISSFCPCVHSLAYSTGLQLVGVLPQSPI